MNVSLINASAGYSKHKNVIRNISCEFAQGSVTAIIGANGSGKSTLLKLITSRLKPSSGCVTIDGKNATDYAPKELARRVAILPQVRNVPSVKAKALVTHGRFPFLSFPRIPSAKDKEIVKQCMLDTDTLQFADTDVASLSGGQRQRVYIAMLLAQQTDVILMDEPTTFLDLNCQFEILDMIKSLKAQGKCVIVVLHDIGQAMQTADNVMLLADGEKVFFGTPEELTASGALEKHMNLSPRKIDGEDYYYFKKAERKQP